MSQKFRNIVYATRSALFTVAIHGFIVAVLVAGFWWPFSKEQSENEVIPIQAQVVSEEIENQLEKQKIEQQLQAAKEEQLAQQQQKIERERKQKEQEQKEQAEQLQIEEQKKLEAEKKAEQEKKREAEQQQQKEKEQKAKEQKEKAQKEREQKEQAERAKKEAQEKKRQQEELAKQAEEEKRKQIEKDARQTLISFSSRIISAIKQEWIRPSGSATGLEAIIQIQVARDGGVLSARVIKSSGDDLFDRSAEVATKKASPLPFPPDPKYYEYNKVFNIRFKPG